ncbi:MAG: RagB/SusD family nutrient uptake outer membrane protein [Bacteroidales bacterium]
MKKYKIIGSLLISFLVLLFISCEEEVLNKDPKTSFSEKDIWNDVELATNYLNDAYDGVGKWGINWDNPRDAVPSLVDDCMQRGDHGIWVFNKGDITADEYGACNRWNWNYDNIRITNVFLQRIDEVPDVTEEQLASLKAQARYIRARCYSDLLNFYSWWEGDNNGVPLLTEPFELGEDFQVRRKSYDEVLSFIVEELDQAKENLPYEWDDDNWGKPTKGACQTLKARMLLYAASKRHNPDGDQEKWQKASDANKAVIDMDQYELVQPVESYEDYAQIWLDRGNSEIIFARSYHPEYTDLNWIDKMNDPNGFTGWGGNCPTEDLVTAYRMEDGSEIDEEGSDYDPQDPFENRELRFYANIVYHGRHYRGREIEAHYPAADAENVSPGLDSRASSIQNWNSSPTGYWWYKFKDESIDFSKENSDVPLILMRLAEVYLNYAEAQYHLGNEGVAREYVNKIRERVNLPDLESSGEELLEDIRRERRLELAFENNHRWCDIRRWGILEETHEKDYVSIVPYKHDDGSITYEREVAMERSFQEKLYNFPIPKSEIEKTDLTQNPGY